MTIYHPRAHPLNYRFTDLWQMLLCAALLLLPGMQVSAQFSATVSIEIELDALQTEREALTREMDANNRRLSLLLGDEGNISESNDPEVRFLSAEVVRIKRRIIKISEREVQLLQQKIAEAQKTEARAAANPEPVEEPGLDTSLSREEGRVARLVTLMNQHNADLEATMSTQPDVEEVARDEAAARDAAILARVPFSADKVRLNGPEGATAVLQISERLNDETLPESRRDIAPICSVRTRVKGNLVSSENRSLKPVGKNHYIARIRLQAGDSELRIRRNSWLVRLPESFEASDFLITLYTPEEGTPELHAIRIDDLLEQESLVIPDWLAAVFDPGAGGG